MNTTNDTLVSNKRIWAGRVLSGLVTAALASAPNAPSGSAEG